MIASVILNYNDSETTISLIEAIRNYDSLNYIIVVDNNSTDDSVERIEKHVSEKVILIKNKKNGGYGYGNNIGIKYSYNILKCDYTLIINPDVLFEEEIINPLISAVENNQNVSLVSCIPINPEKKLAPAWKEMNGFQDVLSASLFFNKLFSKRYYSNDYIFKKPLTEVYQVPGSLILVDTSKMINYGMYDEDFFLYEEEKVIATKFKNNNLKSVLVTDYTYIHNHSVSVDKTFKSKVKPRKILLESKYKFLKKYRKFNKLQLLLSSLFFRFCIFEMWLYSIIKK